MNMWKVLINYFNTKNSGKIFTRAEVRTYLHLKCFHNKDMATVGTYMNTLRRAGYLDYMEPGVYRKLKKIPAISEYQMKQEIHNKRMSDKYRWAYK